MTFRVALQPLRVADPTVKAHVFHTRSRFMYRRKIPVLALTVAVLLGMMAVETEAQAVNLQNQPQFVRRNLGGPRMGVTYVFGNGQLYQDLNENGMGRVISQFGWHFEYQVVPEGGGPQFVIQIVPMFGGVEYGKVLPSTALAMGVRFPSGFEFGMGPEIMVDEEGMSSALIMAIGKTFDYGGVSIPINLVVTRNNDGVRLSMIFGYAIQKRR